MAIYAFGDRVPVIHETAFIHPDAVIIGSVEIGSESTIWAGAVLRGDDGFIKIGSRTSIQDNTVIHTTPMDGTTVGDDCVIGHIVHLEACTIENGSQVSSGAIVLHRVRVGTSPALFNHGRRSNGKRAWGNNGVEEIALGVAVYVDKGKRFAKEMRKISD